MHIRNIVLPAVLVALLLSPAAYAEDEGVFARLIETKTGPLVSVKMVLAIKVTRGGQVVFENEQNATVNAIVVDGAGLVMLPAAAFDPSLGRGRRMMQGLDVQTTPSSLRVVFPGDTNEYPAILGAKDSKLGLAFVLIKDMSAKKDVKVLDLANTVEPKVGDSLYSVLRLGQGFDFAPMCSRARVAGSVTKPRSMWIVEGADDSVSMPLYNAEGAVAGIVVSQTGVGEEADTRAFLLPHKVANPTVAGALKKAKDELERILEEEATKAADEAEAKKKADAEKAADGEKKGEGDKPDDDGKDDGGDE
jgi:hypothetical protein